MSRTLNEVASTGSITRAIGGYANAWLTQRLVTRADFLYIKGVGGRLAGLAHRLAPGSGLRLLQERGLGVQYKYNQYSYDRGVLVSQLGGDVTYKGFQVFLSFLF